MIYEKFSRLQEEIYNLNSIAGILHWDQETQMPHGASESRSRQFGAISAIIHQKKTAPEFRDLLLQLKSDHSLNFVQKKNVELTFHHYERAHKIPETLVVELAKLATKAHVEWVEAKNAKNFMLFKPALSEYIRLKKEYAQCLRTESTQNIYDELLEDFEPGMRVSNLDKIFGDLKGPLKNILDRILETAKKVNISNITFPREKQIELGKEILSYLGYDFNHGRLDEAVHPFCGGAGKHDVRITTRYNEQDFLSGLTGVVHEAGHALYEQGLPEEFFYTDVGHAVSMGIHESQSLLWEKQVGKSKAFWKFAYPICKKHFKELSSYTEEDIYHSINRVEPSFVRVDADEVTYPFHVILRYEIERDLFNNRIQVDDLPQIWNAKMKEYLGVSPPNDALGLLQDVHWSGGAFGYFPSYTLGAINAAQIFATAKATIPSLTSQIESGNFKELRKFLLENIHQQGSLYEPNELMKRVTGKPTDAKAFLSYLETKYLS